MSRVENIAYRIFCIVCAILVIAFIAFVVIAVGYSSRLDDECVARGGVPTRDHNCLRREALMENGSTPVPGYFDKEVGK